MMLYNRFYYCCIAALCLGVASATSEKQIKLEDIEKDTLKAAQQAKYEKQIQQQQQQQYQQTPIQYEPQVYAQQNVAYQTPTSYSQYYLPQQYISPTVFSGYGPLTSNSLGSGYASPSAHAFQAYLSPQLTTIPSVSSFHASQPIAAATQTQPIIMAFASPTFSTLQHQPYYQDAFQYYPTQASQAAQYYYTPHAIDQTSSSQISSASIYPVAQQYLASYQPLSSSKTVSGYSQQQYVSTAPQTFPAQGYSTQPEYSSIYSPQTYSSNSIYSNTETPTFVTVKAPQHLVASQGQQQQYLQAHPTTISPLQTKYLNSPQYLAQNYNTIQTSALFPKASLSSGVKSTASPPVKISGGIGSSYISNNFASSSSSVSSYQPFRNLPPKTF